MTIYRSKFKYYLSLTVVVLLLLLAPALLGQRQSYTVAATFTIADGDVAGLKSAIATANTNGEDDTIDLATTGNYTLATVDNSNTTGSNGLPVIASDGGHALTLNGHGATLARDKSVPGIRLLATNPRAMVTVTDLTFSNGSAANGGGIYNDHASMNVSRCNFNVNYASDSGGGIYNNGTKSGTSTLNLTDCNFSYNITLNLGGAISNDGSYGGSATSTLTRCNSHNDHADSGGAICNNGSMSGTASMQLINCDFDSSRGIGKGGAIYNFCYSAGHVALDVSGCTVSNAVAAYGGGIYSGDDSSNDATATLHVTNSTFCNNYAEEPFASHPGSDIYNDAIQGGTATLTMGNCTFSSPGSMGGIANRGIYGTATLQVANTIFDYGNRGTSIWNLGTVISLGHNLSSDNGGGVLTGSGDQINTDPRLDPAGLKDNGGLTPTIALLGGSPAIDAGDNSRAPATDQRGIVRPQPVGGISDIGAFEALFYTVTGRVSSVSGQSLANATVTLSLTNGGTLPSGTANPVTTNSAGYYSFRVPSGSYTIAPSFDGYTFSPATADVTVNNAGVEGPNFSGRKGSVMTGRISTRSGVAVGNVSIMLSPSPAGVTNPVTTNSAGYYTFQYVPDGTYTLTPTLSGYTFTPVSKSVTVSGADINGQNFIATPVYTITGHINDWSGQALPNTTVSLSISGGGSLPASIVSPVTINSAGYYTFANVPNGSYTITPSLSGYIFFPPTHSATVNGANISGQNFIAATGYRVSGHITTSSGAAISGVSVQLDSGATVTTNSAGYYTFTNVPNGNHTLTPSKSGLTFTPPNKTVNVSGADVSGQNFIGS
jgi:hypothetical protein